eukprot:213739_1
MSRFIQFVTLIFLFNTSTCEIATCGQSDCSCTNKNEFCTLECSGWTQCLNAQLDCNPNQPCEIDCDGGDRSCENVIINSNGATSLTVHCNQWQDCYAATVNCGTANSCQVNCDGGGLNPNHICDKINLNCGTSRCGILCAGDANEGDATCGNINVDTSDPNIYSFECTSTPEFPNACAHAPPQVLPPTQDPTNDPTLEPTIPTTNPSKAPTIPTVQPTTMPSASPTIHFEVISNITIEIEVDDPNISDEEIEDLVDETTGAYLDTLFVESDYKLSVDIIKSDGDVLTVNIVVSTNGDIMDINEKEIVDENEKEIKQQYGDKVRIKSDKKDSGIKWYIYVILGVVILILIIAILVLIYAKNRLKKRKATVSDKHNVEIGLTDTKATMGDSSPIVNNNVNGSGTNGESGIIKTNDSDNGENSVSDTAENLYTEHVTKGMNDENNNGINEQQIQQDNENDSENEIYGAGTAVTVGNDLPKSIVETNNGNILNEPIEEDDADNDVELALNKDEHEDSIEDIYGGDNMTRVQSTSQM